MAELLAGLAVLVGLTGAAGGVPYREVSAPPGKARGQVILLHGGGWAGDDPARVRHVDPYARRLRQWGYVVHNLDYPTGGPESVRSVRRYYDRQLAGARKPVYAMGVSAGGHIALMLGATRRLEGVVAIGAPSDLTTLPEFVGGGNWDSMRQRRRFSPYHRRMKTPSLLAHARADVIVDHRQSSRFARRHTGVRVVKLGWTGEPFVLDPGDRQFVHGYVDGRDFVGFIRQTRRFLEGHG